MKTLENRRSFGTALFITFCLLLLPQAVLAWQGLVIGINDGDTITVLRDGREQVKIRLYGIGCPEKRLAWGTAPKKQRRRFATGKR